MNTWVLIIVIVTATYGDAGTSSMSAEFTSKENCLAAGSAIINKVKVSSFGTRTWGCYKK